MRKLFYLRLALSNIRRNRETHLPDFAATAIMSCVFFLTSGLATSEGLSGVPSGDTAKQLFLFGTIVIGLFVAFFMLYINGFLIRRRKKEFGLYGVLGLSKRHVGHVVFWEKLIVMTGGVLMGVLVSLALGRLLFMLLLKLIRSAPGIRFTVGWQAYVLTGVLFAAIFVAEMAFNLISVRLSNPVELLAAPKKGERDGKLVLPLAIIGLLLLGGAYYFAWTIERPGIALGLFFPLALVVIVATYALFRSGSIQALRVLRANKGFYYKPKNFITVSSMFHRMRQNARGLSSICILSVMLIVTVSGTLSLYLAQEGVLDGMYPYDVELYMGDIREEYVDFLIGRQDEYGVTMSADPSKLVDGSDFPEGERYYNNVYLSVKPEIHDVWIYCDGRVTFDLAGNDDDCVRFLDETQAAYVEAYPDADHRVGISDIFHERQRGYKLFGGLLFLGAFFGVLFLAVTALIIYFKQINEGREDQERFEILQKVGMDEVQVKSAINRQILIVFFLPLLAAVMHMVFASRIMTRMLQSLMVCDWALVLKCIVGTSVLFALVYYVVYRVTARAYLRIVRRR